jgi:hypothetical protein
MRHVFLLPDEIDHPLAFKNKDVSIFWMPRLAEGYIGEIKSLRMGYVWKAAGRNHL